MGESLFVLKKRDGDADAGLLVLLLLAVDLIESLRRLLPARCILIVSVNCVIFFSTILMRVAELIFRLHKRFGLYA
jgi:hypothetical protein